MRLARVAVVAAVAVVALFVVAPAWAATTIDSGNANIAGGTLTDCDNTDIFNDDIPVVPLFNGPFNYSQSVSPAAATANCADGSGSDSTTGSLTTSGTIDPLGNMTLSQTSFGQTTATANYTGNPQTGDSIDVGDGVNSGTSVDFTITTAMPYTFSGTGSSTQAQKLHYSLVRTSSPSQTIFDDSAGLVPHLSGVLSPGSYTYTSSGAVSNDVCCTISQTLSDHFAYDWTFSLGDHYRVELNAWVPQARTVDPYQPQSLPAALVQIPPLSHARPLCTSLSSSQSGSTLVSTSERGDGHAGYAGGSRVDVVADFDWDGSQISNFVVSPPPFNFAPTDLDFSFSPLAGGTPFATCSTHATASRTTSGAVTPNGAGFTISFDVSDPLVSAPFALPPMDTTIQGSFDPQNNLQLQFGTDLFPSYAVKVTRNGVLQDTSILNDASCLAAGSVLGTTGLSLLSVGLSPAQQNTGTLLVPTNSQGHTGSRSSPLCSASYDTLQIVSGSGPAPFPAVDAAVPGSSILVAPASGGTFVPLAQALKSKLVSGMIRNGRAVLLVDAAHPVRIKATGAKLVVQDVPIHAGRAGAGTQFGPVTGTVTLAAGTTVTATAKGHKLKPRPSDHKPPHTTATVTVKGKFATVRFVATDASGVARTVLIVAGKVVKLKHGTVKIKASQLASARFYSIDVLGNLEKAHRLRRH